MKKYLFILLLLCTSNILAEELSFTPNKKFDIFKSGNNSIHFSEDSKTMMKVNNVADTSWISLFNVETNQEIYHTVLNSSNLKVKGILNDAERAICVIDYKPYIYNLKTKEVVDSIKIDNTYDMYYMYLEGNYVLGGFTSLLLAVNINTKEKLMQFNVPIELHYVNYKMDFKGDYLCLYSPNSSTFIIHNYKTNQTTKLDDSNTIYAELSKTGKYLVYIRYDSTIVRNLLTNEEKGFQNRSSNIGDFINNKIISDNEKDLYLQEHDNIYIYDMETLEKKDSLNRKITDYSKFQFSQNIYLYSFDNYTFTYFEPFGLVNKYDSKTHKYLYTFNTFTINSEVSSLSLSNLSFSNINDDLRFVNSIYRDYENDTLITIAFPPRETTLLIGKELYYYFPPGISHKNIDTRIKKSICEFSANITDMCYLKDKNMIAVGASDGKISLIDLETDAVVYELNSGISNLPMDNLRLSADGKYLMGGADCKGYTSDYTNNKMVVWNISNFNSLTNKTYTIKTTLNNYFSNDSKYILKDNLSVYEITTGTTSDLVLNPELGSETKPNTFSDYGFTFDGKYIFASSDKAIYIWDYETKKHIQTNRIEENILGMRISNVSNTICLIKDNQSIDVLKYNPKSGIFDKTENSILQSIILKSNSSIIINNDLINPEFAIYELFNSNGELINQNYTCNITDKSIEFNSMGLISGTYFLNIVNNGKSEIYKIMIISE